MLRIPLLATLLLAAPALLAGCLGEEKVPADAQAVAASAQEAGAVAGPAPAAADRPFQVADAQGEAPVTVYPLAIETNAAKAPYVNEFTGVYEPQECAPTGGGLPLGGLGLAQGGERFDVAEAFAQNDVYSYDVSLTWTNTDQSWAELHLWHRFDTVSNFWSEPTSEGRGEIVLNFTGQGFIVSEEILAMVGVQCWYGFVTQPIPFTIRVAIAFAEGAVPAQAPVLVRVPEGATRLFATGVALDPSQPVLSHYRVFGPDDALVCECALSSDEATDVLELAQPGDHVVLIDHTANGFLSFGLDAPAASSLVPLATELVVHPLAASEGGALDETITLDVPSTPLGMWAWVFAPGDAAGSPDAGAGHNMKITVANARGDVLRIAMAGYVTFHASAPGAFTTNEWMAIPMDGEWEFFTDHHAYDLGPHLVTVKADAIRGEARLFAQHYVRP